MAGITPCSPGTGRDLTSSTPCSPCQPGFFQPQVNYEPCLPCWEGSAAPLPGATECVFCLANNTLPNQARTQCLPRTSAQVITEALVGNYENLLYSGAAKNDWHYVQISAKADSDTQLIWKNRAGVQWTLELQKTDDGYNRNVFTVESDSPYYSNGHTEGHVTWTAQTEYDAGNTVISVTGPWNEAYTRV
eukprot:TRINITY_DN48889_c0_g1_i1.p1 TRINITY_DN48889_c0_g1~~TRINITY_DN48889_c0_g1_i1.p1  ORF type:complete len:210 (+),score=14.18 TRINITY_DN48889_c0_g1_i1:62-631(+)